MVTNISMADFYEKYQNEHLDFIDVREAHEFQAGHAPGAKNLPLRRSAFRLCLSISQRPRPHRYQCRRWYECLAW